MDSNLGSVVSGAHHKKQMRLPFFLGFGLATGLALYVLFADPLGAGTRWSKLNGGRVDIGNRKAGTHAVMANNTNNVGITQKQTPEPEVPVISNGAKKSEEIDRSSTPPSLVPSPSNLAADEPKQASPSPPPTARTKNDYSQVVLVPASPLLSPPPHLVTKSPRNASSVTADKQHPAANASPDPFKPQNPVAADDEELLSVLRRASMGNNTVIITTLNDAWAAPNSVIDLFFESFRIGIGTQGLLKYLVIIAVDPSGYERCKDIHHHCYLMVTKGKDFSKEERFMTPDYMAMMWRRLQFLGSVVELGFSFVFTDTDIMWFRNPFLHFDPSADLSIACDRYVGDPYNLHNPVNAGFYYVQSNPRTIEFFKYWYRSRWQHPKNHEQDVFNMIRWDDFTNKLGMKIRYLDTMYFSGFCERTKYFGKVITMHANCCVGLQKKLDDLRLVLEDWGNYTKFTEEERRYRNITWRAPKNC